VQQRLLVQVLHSAELRLRIKAFMQHFQHASFGSSSSSSSSGDASGSKQPGPCSLQGGCGADGSRSSKGTQDHGSPATAVSVQRAFLDAVAQVLSEHDASLATGQVQKLLQQQRRRGGGTASLLQLLTTQRGMARQLQQLAEVCCCTVQVFMEERPFLKDSIITAEGVCRLGRWQDVAADSASSSTSTSSTINFHVLQAVRGGQQSRLAAAAGFVSAAADAYKQSALPWPGHAEMAAALQLGWAPSSWQMCRGFEGGNVLLERLYAGEAKTALGLRLRCRFSSWASLPQAPGI
jgi:hypothetical protein